MTLTKYLFSFITAFVALFPVINPIGSAFIINRFIGHFDHRYRGIAIRRIISNSLAIALGSLILGHFILLMFGLAVPVIQLGGGLLICYNAWGWLKDDSDAGQKQEHGVQRVEFSRIERKLFYPISFPITVGAGTMAVIFTLMASINTRDTFLHIAENYSAIALAIVAICVILYLVLAPGHRITRRLGVAGELIVNKIISFLTLCIGLQIMAGGIGAIFHIPVL